MPGLEPLPRFGLNRFDSRSVDAFAADVRRAEQLGWDAALQPDSQLRRRDTYVLLAAAARVTERIALGPLLANPVNRHPTVTASSIATVDELPSYDAIIFGTPTRFGNMAAQMRNFLDQTGGLWMKGSLIGKVGSVFASTATQHGGQETTITSFHTTLLHQGMIIVGVPYSAPGLMNMSEISGGTPYGATTLAAPDGSRKPSANELDIARFQGKHVAEIASKLAAKT